MKKLKVETPIAVYKTVVFEVEVPDGVDTERLKEEIINGRYDIFVNGGGDLLDKCKISEVDEYIRDVDSSEMYDGDITEFEVYDNLEEFCKKNDCKNPTPETILKAFFAVVEDADYEEVDEEVVKNASIRDLKKAFELLKHDPKIRNIVESAYESMRRENCFLEFDEYVEKVKEYYKEKGIV